ncbi:MAG TPA: DNRLRE domain-containing protein [Gemmataceae bacterium]|nr:DNRLRE domain-containing protein [Gemmataceae bacterium]
MPRLLSSLLAGLYAVTAAAAPPVSDKVLFDFEQPKDIDVWSNLVLPEPKWKEPPVRIEASERNATSGRKSLKLTFDGGEWPTVITTAIPDDWSAYHTFRADVTVDRECVVGFTVMQEKSNRGPGYDNGVTRWCKTAFLKPGKNTVAGNLQPNDWSAIGPKFGKVVSLEAFLYDAHKGESIYLDNIRLSAEKLNEKPIATKFTVLGTDLVVESVQDLGKRLAKDWKKPVERTLADVDADFAAAFETARKDHPKAAKAVFRDGEAGYAGWRDAYWSSHGPDGITRDRAENRGTSETHEVFMRHRSPLMRVDLSSIPQGASILYAKLVIVRARKNYSKDHNPTEKPNMWVVEPCNRPWVEAEVNAYRYAKDKYWKEIGGRYYGDDPDFMPVYLAHGPSQGVINEWDFVHAVQWWTDGKHANHGFMLHGDSHDWLGSAWSREAKDVKNRPAVYVIYEPR